DLDDVGEPAPYREPALCVELDGQVVVAAHAQLQRLDARVRGAGDERLGHDLAEPLAAGLGMDHDLGQLGQVPEVADLLPAPQSHRDQLAVLPGGAHRRVAEIG